MDENSVTTEVTEAETENAVAPPTPDVASSANDEEDAIVPEGWKPDGNPAPDADGASNNDKSLRKLFGLTNEDMELFGLTKADDEAKAQSETETQAESVPDVPPPKEPEATPQEPEPDYKTMYEELLRSTRDAQGRETFRQVYEEQKAAGMSDAAARLVAKDAAGGKEFPLTDEGDASGNAGKPDYAAALNQLHSAFPDVKDIPAEVTKSMMEGGDPVTAYMSYQRTQDQKTIGELQTKIRDMEQKAANTVHAVARGVSGNGAKQSADDDFLKGMMAEDW